MAVSSAPTSRFHTPRLGARRGAIAKAFSITAMERAWSTYVRDGLRKQEILDLHDYLDFHRNRAPVFSSLSKEIVQGHYAPASSHPVRVEKKHGVTRTLVIPCPEDAVLLQCLVEAIYPAARNKQPSRNAFFSRSHGFAKPELRFYADYIWFRRWAVFSKMRFDMVSAHRFICVTDIANYFDNIDYRHLRNVITTLDAFDEVILDLLFLILDTISWRPDYLPSPGKSLPQVNFDAPRLLSHVFLFEVDAFLKERTRDQFVRWVDDITVAVDSRSEGKEVLRDLDELLMTRGLRLNSGKTVILSPTEAREYFWQAENQFLDEQRKAIDAAKGDERALSRIRRRLRRRFDALFDSAKRIGHWDKVIKRYISLFAQLEDGFLIRRTKVILETEPGLREAFWRYLSSVGPDGKAFEGVRSYLIGDHALDDASIFQAAHALVWWQVRPSSSLHRRIRQLGVDLGSAAFVSKSPIFFLASLWILGKYGFRSHIVELIERHKDTWRVSSFLSRQVASIFPKFRKHGRRAGVRKLIEKHKHPSATSVLLSLDAIELSGPQVSPDLLGYVLNGKNRRQYTLQRFLICLQVLSASRIPVPRRKALRKEILKYVTDPLYTAVLRALQIS